MNKVNKYERLTADIKAAIEYANSSIDIEDSGILNFDCPMLYLPHWNISSVKSAIEKSGAYADVLGHGEYRIKVNHTFHANARTMHADSMCEYLKRIGYNTYTFHLNT